MTTLHCFALFGAILTVAASNEFRSDYEYNVQAQRWLKFHKTPASWALADLQCFYEGGILASPIDKNTKDVMISIIRQNKNLTELGVHTGINNRHSNVKYTSIEGVALSKISVQYEGMFSDEYSSSTHCMRMYLQGDLLAGNCEDALPYICYRENTGPLKMTECGTVDKEYHYDRRTGHCYKFHYYATNWTLAFMTCEAEGGHLAIINSGDEANVLKELYAKHPDKNIRGEDHFHIAFIGFLDWYKKGTWRTIHGQSLSNAGYENWGSGQPDSAVYKGQPQRCGAMFRNGQLDDLACEHTHAFICEKNPKSLRP